MDLWVREAAGLSNTAPHRLHFRADCAAKVSAVGRRPLVGLMSF